MTEKQIVEAAQDMGVAFLASTALIYVLVSGVAYLLVRNKRRVLAIERSLQRLQVTVSSDEAQRIHESHGFREYVFPWLLAVLLTFLGALTTATVAATPGAAGTSSANPIEREAPTAMFYAFVGSAVFTTQMIYRRYVAFDLKPAVYFFIATRIIVAVGVAFVAEVVFVGDMAARSDGYGRSVAYLFGFFAGLFPEAALLWLRNWLRQHLPFNSQAEARPVPLTMIQGCNGYQQARLLEEGIEDAHNLATADIVRLVVRTPFDLELLFDWIDQAVLYIHVPDDTLRSLRQIGIRAISDFFEVFDLMGDVEQVIQQMADATRDLPDGVSPVRADQIRMLYHAAYRDPNREFVCRFWQNERRRASAPHDAEESGEPTVGAMAF